MSRDEFQSPNRATGGAVRTTGLSTENERPPPLSRGLTPALAGLGASLLGLAAGACCVPVIAPLLVSVLGVSGAVYAAGLEAYSVPALAAAGLVLGYGFFVVRRGRSRGADACPSRRPALVSALLWTAAIVWVGSIVIVAVGRSV